ncbi:hypothetical protein TL16_g11778 [Triparma laevis f. inornata]|uniref:Uncharacterized protein n=1 Tax=Triparma laevis f. inornata TaxID=1714386 RepID=A0A9W7BG43_9STRA|nr:hypothetical protein TL16_g11778 [Triparma laevis f. inornata]
MDLFCLQLLDFMQNDTLLIMRMVSQEWKEELDYFIESQTKEEDNIRLIVHNGKDLSVNFISDIEGYVLDEEPYEVLRVIFFLNVPQIGAYACTRAEKLIVVDIPEGV